jgi:RimJ/RimL family protein N-acetyltransferase
VFLGGRLAGVGALKRLGAHHDTIIGCCGFKDLNSFSAEIDYFHIDPSGRGKGFAGKLVKFLLSQSSGAVYATTREDNEAMQHIQPPVGGFLVDGAGFEPATPALRTPCSPS